MKSLLIRSESVHPLDRVSPLTPLDMGRISLRSGKAALVQPSAKRCFADHDYVETGGRLVFEVGEGDVILGVRAPEREALRAGRLHAYFCGAASGQLKPMEELREVLEAGTSLIDLGRITDAQGRQLVGLGPFAGHAAALDTAWLLGRRWASRGLITPLGHCRRASSFPDLAQGLEEFRRIGRVISGKGFPRDVSPVIFCVIGHGAVSRAFQSVLECLPMERIEPAALSAFCRQGQGDPRKVYLAIFEERHLVERADGHSFDLRDYIVHPWLYRSRLDRYLPWTTVLVNAASWDSRYPRFVTWESLERLAERPGGSKLQALIDISGQVGGSIESTVRTTSSEEPVYRCDPSARRISDGLEGEGIPLMAVQDIEGELPIDVSRFLSKQLQSYVPQILLADFSTSLAEGGLSEEVRRGVVVYRGQLTEPYHYLEEFLDRDEAQMAKLAESENRESSN